jgi:hypothetical protein
MTDEKRDLAVVGRVDTEDRYNIEKLRAAREEHLKMAATELLTVVRLGPPLKHDWIRVHPSEEMSLELPLIDIPSGAGKDTYYVNPALEYHFPETFVKWKQVYLYLNRLGDVGLWPISTNLRGNAWIDSALMAIEEGKTSWVHIMASQERGKYLVYYPDEPIMDKPVWPQDKSLRDYLTLAFKGREIWEIKDDLLLRLRGAKKT